MTEENNPRVLMETSMGSITLELNPAKAPKTVANFLSYVDAGHYDGTIFHRVISNFMIQGGGFDERMSERDTGDPIENEADNGLGNEKARSRWLAPPIRTARRRSSSSTPPTPTTSSTTPARRRAVGLMRLREGR